MDIFEEIIAKLEQIPGSEGTIAELVAEKARFSDPSSDEARIAALMILKKAADASSSSDSAPTTTGLGNNIGHSHYLDSGVSWHKVEP